MLDVPYLAPTQLPDDRSGRFIATGVILLLLAALSGCLSASMPMAIVRQQQMAGVTAGQATYGNAGATYPQQPVSTLVIGAVMYLGFTVAAGWLGVAALNKHRYVRPLVLILATHGIIFGVLTVAAFALFMPIALEQMRRTMPNAAAFAPIGLAFVGAFMLIFFVGFPIVLLVLMKPEAVRLTAEHYDLRRRWTDGLPIKLLGLVVTLGVLTLFELMMLNQHGLPVLFTTITGPLFVLITLLHTAVIGASTVLVYRRRMLGWHLAFYGLTIPSLVFCVSSVTLPSDQYLLMVDNERDVVDLVREYETYFRTFWAVSGTLFLLATAIYLLRMRPLVEPPLASVASE